MQRKYNSIKILDNDYFIKDITYISSVMRSGDICYFCINNAQNIIFRFNEYDLSHHEVLNMVTNYRNEIFKQVAKQHKSFIPKTNINVYKK